MQKRLFFFLGILLYVNVATVWAQDTGLSGISIEGTLLMLDDKTPHVAVPVQAIRSSRGIGDFPRSSRGIGDFPHSSRGMGDFPHKVIATTLSDEDGEYRLVNLKPGQYQVRCQVLGGYVYYRASDDALRFTFYDSQATEKDTGETIYVEHGKTLRNISFRFAPFKKGTWKTYTPLDGLADNSVLVIEGGPDGVMWIGTDVGVSRYDGKEFVNFTPKDGLVHEQVWSVHSARDGVMWFGTSGGVSRYIPPYSPLAKGGSKAGFANFTTEDGLGGGNINSIYSDPDGVMWFATGWGLSRYDGRDTGDVPHFINFTTEDGLVSNEVSAIYGGSDGVMWIGTNGGVSRYIPSYSPLAKGGSRGEFVNFTTKDGLVSNVVRAIYGDSDGVMWFGTDSGVSRYDDRGMGDSPHFVNFTIEDGLVDNVVRAIYGDSDGAMWFGTKGGVSRYDGRDMGDVPHFVNFTTEDGLADNIVNSVYIDTHGVMWFATEWGGLSRYDAKTFVNLTTKDGLAGNDVRSIYLAPDGVMWLGAHGGVSRYDGRGMGDLLHSVNFTTKEGLVNSRVKSIYRAPDGVMWFGTDGGVSRYIPPYSPLTKGGSKAEFVNFTTKDGLVNDMVNAIRGDPDGVMWIGTFGGGVSRYDGKEFVNLTAQDGLAHNFVRDVYADPDGVLWFATNGGISRYDARGMEDSPHFVNLTTEDGLANNLVRAIYRDPDGVLWLATNGGVSRYDGQTFTNFTVEDGLAHNRIESIYRTSDGVLCFGTGGSGVSLFDGMAWTSLDTRDGLAGDNIYSIHEDADGSLWFGTNGGATRYRRSTTPPRVHIASIQITGQFYTDLTAIPAIAIGSHITIACDATDFKTVPEKRQYRYRIYETRDMRRETGDMKQESLRSEVSSLRSQVFNTYNPPTREANFDWTFKKPGTFVFEVQAIDRDLNYSEPASLELKVLPPPFYTRAEFIIGTILAAFFIPSGVYTCLLVRQKKQAFEPIPNPYIVGNPIRSREMFFGRRSDFEFIRIKLASERAGLVIVFAGERRSGKTSILFQILNGELGERCLPVLLDMQAMTVDSEAEFFEKMASEINEALVRAGINPVPTEFRTGNPTRIFERFIAQTMEALEGKALLLLLDEYELIEAKIDDGVLRPDLITFFASLLEAHPRLSFIFTGSRHLEQRNVAYWRVLIGKSLYRHISFLSQRDALRLITEPVKEQVVYPRGIPERIVRLTAGQPFYTQVICQNLMDRLNEVQRNRVRQEDVDAVAQELADNPLPQMIYFWDGLEPEQQSALSLLGEVLEDSSRYASAQMLVDFAQEQNLGLELESSDLEQILDELFVSEVLERERAGEGKYEYRFRVDLFRLWVRRAHSVWQTV